MFTGNMIKEWDYFNKEAAAMAKISANGSKEVDKFRVGNSTFVLCSDGRVLSKVHYSGGGSSGYSVFAKNKDQKFFNHLRHVVEQRHEERLKEAGGNV